MKHGFDDSILSSADSIDFVVNVLTSDFSELTPSVLVFGNKFWIWAEKTYPPIIKIPIKIPNITSKIRCNVDYYVALCYCS